MENLLDCIYAPRKDYHISVDSLFGTVFVAVFLSHIENNDLSDLSDYFLENLITLERNALEDALRKASANNTVVTINIIYEHEDTEEMMLGCGLEPCLYPYKANVIIIPREETETITEYDGEIGGDWEYYAERFAICETIYNSSLDSGLETHETSIVIFPLSFLTGENYNDVRDSLLRAWVRSQRGDIDVPMSHLPREIIGHIQSFLEAKPNPTVHNTIFNNVLYGDELTRSWVRSQRGDLDVPLSRLPREIIEHIQGFLKNDVVSSLESFYDIIGNDDLYYWQ